MSNIKGEKCDQCGTENTYTVGLGVTIGGSRKVMGHISMPGHVSCVSSIIPKADVCSADCLVEFLSEHLENGVLADAVGEFRAELRRRKRERGDSGS